jgi:hypothetical protein
MKNDSHIKGSAKASTPATQSAGGAVPQHKRLAMGKGDGVSNPNGAGNTSTKSTIANGGKKRY